MKTKDKIIDTAIRLFSEYSVTEVTLQRIADESGIQKAAVYYYFKTKGEITGAIVAYARRHIVFQMPTLAEIKAQLLEIPPRQILMSYTMYKNDHNECINLLRSIYRLSLHDPVIAQFIFDRFAQFRTKVFRILSYLRYLNAIPDGDIITLATLWANTTLVHSILFTHDNTSYNDYCNTIYLLVNTAVNDIPVFHIDGSELAKCKVAPANMPHTTRELIAYHAFDLFCTYGFEKTTVRQIAKRVGIQIGSIYKHYESKDEILREIMVAAKEKYFDNIHSFNGYMEQLRQKKDIHLLIKAMASCYIPIEDPTANKAYRLLLLEQYRNKKAKDFWIGNHLEDCRAIEAALNILVIENIIPPCPSHQIAWAYAFNHCALCIQSALLNRDIANSRDYRIKSSALLVGAIMSGAYLPYTG